MASGGVQMEKNSAGHWEFEHDPLSTWATQSGFFSLPSFVFLLQGGHKGREMDMGELGSEHDQDA